jgi:hypothetical protein
MRAYLVVGVLLGLAALVGLRHEQPVKASSDCPVLNATPDGIGGAVVQFDCGAVYVTIHEPVWPAPPAN